MTALATADNRQVIGSIDGSLGLLMSAQRNFASNSTIVERVQATLFLLK
jgi:hypothetical protein